MYHFYLLMILHLYLQIIECIYIYLIICYTRSMLSPSKQSPSDIIHLFQRFFQSSKHFWYALFGMSLSSLSDSVFISSIVAKRRPLMDLFNLGNRNKSQGAKSGEYGGWGMITVFFFWPKNYEQAMTSEQVRYRDAKAMNFFSTIPGVFFGMAFVLWFRRHNHIHFLSDVHATGYLVKIQ